MRERWNLLALREKQILGVGAVFIIACLIYLLLWLPLTNRTESMRKQIKSNQALLVWMQEAEKKISAGEKPLKQTSLTPSEGSLLSIVQKQINRTPLVSALTDLHQLETDSVQLTFQKVSFDQLMKWLIQITAQEALFIVQLTVTPSASPGIADVVLVLKQ
jgi:type II secretory pathway component PulM